MMSKNIYNKCRYKKKSYRIEMSNILLVIYKKDIKTLVDQFDLIDHQNYFDLIFSQYFSPSVFC